MPFNGYVAVVKGDKFAARKTYVREGADGLVLTHEFNEAARFANIDVARVVAYEAGQEFAMAFKAVSAMHAFASK